MENSAPLLVNGEPFKGNVINDSNADVIINGFRPDEFYGEDGVYWHPIHDPDHPYYHPNSRIRNNRKECIFQKRDLLIIAARNVKIINNFCQLDIFSAKSILFDDSGVDYSKYDDGDYSHNHIRIFGANHNIKIISTYDYLRLQIFCSYSSIEIPDLEGDAFRPWIEGSNLNIKFTSDSYEPCYMQLDVSNSNIEFHGGYPFHEGIFTVSNTAITFFSEEVFSEALRDLKSENICDENGPLKNNKIYLCVPQAELIDAEAIRKYSNNEENNA